MLELRCDHCESKWSIEAFTEIRSVPRRCCKGNKRVRDMAYFTLPSQRLITPLSSPFIEEDIKVERINLICSASHS